MRVANGYQKTVRPASALALVLPMALGCASMFLNGGKFADGTEPGRVIAKYSLTGCVNLADNAPIQGPNAEYWLLREEYGVSLMEKDNSSQSVVITNHWPAGDADHFFVSVSGSGWEYVVPRDRNQSGTRLVYTKVVTTGSGSVVKPTSQPGAKCTLTPQFVPGPTAEPVASGATTPVATAAPASDMVPPPAPAVAPAPAPTGPPAAAPTAAPPPPTAAPAPPVDTSCFPPCRTGYICRASVCVAR